MIQNKKHNTFLQHILNRNKKDYTCVACRRKKHGECTKTRWGKQSICTCKCIWSNKLRKRVIPITVGTECQDKID